MLVLATEASNARDKSTCFPSLSIWWPGRSKESDEAPWGIGDETLVIDSADCIALMCNEAGIRLGDPAGVVAALFVVSNSVRQ